MRKNSHERDVTSSSESSSWLASSALATSPASSSLPHLEFSYILATPPANPLVSRFFADILLAPMEATRIRLVSNPQYAPGMLSGLAKIARTEGVGSLYAGFLPLICKQIPYAIGQVSV